MSDDDSAPAFIVDRMLGSLARWLRMLGYDSHYDKILSDNEIIGLARKEKRKILTRDRELAERGGGFYISSTELEGQLVAVAKEFSLTYRPDRMRCSICNGALQKIDAVSIKDKVPQKSFESAKEFWRCDSCRKIYWDGTHWKGIMDRFERLGLTRGRAE
jgi:uncharacterized protein with PIN domain